MEENKNNQTGDNQENLIDDLFANKGNTTERQPGQVWEPGDGKQAKFFKNAAFISFAAGIIIGGILIFFFGKYM